MKNFFKEINRSFNGLVVNLLVGGILLLIFAVLIVWVDFVLRLVIGCAFLIASWVTFYAAYKIYYFKKHVQDFITRIK